jgi:hypothetical protein
LLNEVLKRDWDSAGSSFRTPRARQHYRAAHDGSERRMRPACLRRRPRRRLSVSVRSATTVSRRRSARPDSGGAVDAAVARVLRAKFALGSSSILI